MASFNVGTRTRDSRGERRSLKQTHKYAELMTANISHHTLHDDNVYHDVRPLFQQNDEENFSFLLLHFPFLSIFSPQTHIHTQSQWIFFSSFLLVPFSIRNVFLLMMIFCCSCDSSFYPHTTWFMYETVIFSVDFQWHQTEKALFTEMLLIMTFNCNDFFPANGGSFFWLSDFFFVSVLFSFPIPGTF